MSEQQHVEQFPFASANCAQVCAALAAAQAKFKAPKRNKPVKVKTKSGDSYEFNYAPLEEVLDSIKEGMTENGLSVYQHLGQGAQGYYIRTYIIHSSGEWIGGHDYPVMYSRDGAQGFASGVTYSRRYGLCVALGIAPEDDDANAAEGNTIVQPQQAATQRGQRRPKPPAENVMGMSGPYPPHDPVTGEIDEKPVKQIDEEYLRHDALLMAAAQGRGGLPATQKLREEWTKLPPVMQHRLLPNLAGYKSVATQVDLGFEQAQEGLP